MPKRGFRPSPDSPAKIFSFWALAVRCRHRHHAGMTDTRQLAQPDADTPDALAASIAAARDYDRFSGGLISSPPAILATVQRDVAAIGAAHARRIHGERRNDLALRRMGRL